MIEDMFDYVPKRYYNRKRTIAEKREERLKKLWTKVFKAVLPEIEEHQRILKLSREDLYKRGGRKLGSGIVYG